MGADEGSWQPKEKLTFGSACEVDPILERHLSENGGVLRAMSGLQGRLLSDEILCVRVLSDVTTGDDTVVQSRHTTVTIP